MAFGDSIDHDSLRVLTGSFERAVHHLYSLGVHRQNVRLKAYREFLAAISAGEGSRFQPEDAVRLWR